MGNAQDIFNTVISPANILTALRTNGMWDTAFREVVSNNTPHVLIVRTKDEAIDQGISQYGNTIAYFGTGLLMNKWLDKLAAKKGIVFEQLGDLGKSHFKRAKSLSIFAMIASTMLAMPFLRNYVTTSRTGTTNYAEMIGETKDNGNSKKELQKTLNGFALKFFGALAVGATLSVTAWKKLMKPLKLAQTAGTALKELPKFWKWFNKHLGLQHNDFKNFNEWGAFAFWTIPTYSGLFAGARDFYELKELALRFAAFNFAFFIFPKTFEKGLDKLVTHLKVPNTKVFGPPQNIAYLGKVVSGMILCSAIPTVVNIYLTRQRVKRDGTKNIAKRFLQFMQPNTSPHSTPQPYQSRSLFNKNHTLNHVKHQT